MTRRKRAYTAEERRKLEELRLRKLVTETVGAAFAALIPIVDGWRDPDRLTREVARHLAPILSGITAEEDAIARTSLERRGLGVAQTTEDGCSS